MVQRIIEWLLDSPNPEIDREYGDPVTSDRQASFDDTAEEDDIAMSGDPSAPKLHV